MREFVAENTDGIASVLAAVVVVALAVWVYRDSAARERRSGRAPLGVVPAIWVVAMVLAAWLTLIVYLFARRAQDGARHRARDGRSDAAR